MFNKTYVLPYEKAVPYEKSVVIHNHRQSTSDDAKLLKELEREALDKITESAIEKVGNVLSVLKFVKEEDFAAHGKKLYLVFYLNNEKIEIKLDVNYSPVANQQQLIVEALVGEITPRLISLLMRMP